jgi:hypothetical protein
VKLSISEVPPLVPTSLVPSPLNRTSPGEEPSGRGTVAGVDREQEVAVARDLQGTLRTDSGSRSGATRRERRAAQRRQRAVGVSVEGGLKHLDAIGL